MNLIAIAFSVAALIGGTQQPRRVPADVYSLSQMPDGWRQSTVTDPISAETSDVFLLKGKWISKPSFPFSDVLPFLNVACRAGKLDIVAINIGALVAPGTKVIETRIDDVQGSMAVKLAGDKSAVIENADFMKILLSKKAVIRIPSYPDFAVTMEFDVKDKYQIMAVCGIE